MRRWISKDSRKFSCMCLINNGNSSKGKKEKKNSRKIYPKLFQMNLRKRHLFYNQGVEGGRTHRSDFMCRCDLLKRLKATQRGQHWAGVCQDQKECPFLGLGRENIFLSRDCLNFRSRSKKCQYTLSFSGSPSRSILSTEKRKGGPLCVPANRGKKKKNCFLTFRGHR